ncbi:MAG TPA: sigma-70 family RNA polymerase sigma factor [bacterium]|nr:sigma-70 family RNA polymerase sigma factor [bacterium]HPN44107.1 sigma-70 family RNA polymerase sigma factor [bacterium]
MNDNDSRQLVEKVLAGNSRAFQTFVNEYKNLVAHIVYRMVNILEDREDLCQDIFVKAYQNLFQFKFESKVSTWIARIAYNTCINYLEKKKVPLYDDLAPEDTSLDSLAGINELQDDLYEAENINNIVRKEIAEMPVKFRTILTLYHLDEMTYAEIGSITGLPEGTVKNYLFRARRFLKAKLTARYQPEELYQ